MAAYAPYVLQVEFSGVAYAGGKRGDLYRGRAFASITVLAGLDELDTDAVQKLGNKQRSSRRM